MFPVVGPSISSCLGGLAGFSGPKATAVARIVDRGAIAAVPSDLSGWRPGVANKG